MNALSTDTSSKDLDKIARSLRQETRNALGQDILWHARNVVTPSGWRDGDDPRHVALSHFFGVLAAATHDLRRK